jgi:hypothetical protein
MIDFLKLNVSYLSESEFLNNPQIELKQSVNRNTGEMGYPIKGEYLNLDIKLNPKIKEISGSIHKLRNEIKTSQNQNYDDFTFDDVREMIFHLKEVFNLDLDITIIQNLEIGLNINTDKLPERILNENLIVCNNKTPSKNKDYNRKGKYIEFETSQCIVKIYDKGKQYDRKENILRFECKIKRNEFLNKFGINTLNDLLIRDHLKALQDYLFETFSKCVVVDDLSPETITEPKEREIFTKGINPLTWTSLKGMQKKRFKDSFVKILDKYSLNTIQKEIESKLRAKGKELLECYDMNDFQNIESNSQKDEMLRYEPYIYVHNVTLKKCKITGIDITHQKGESKFLSQASIMKMYDVNRKTFNELKEKFGPKNPDKMPIDKLCLEIAHNIRNRDSNKRHEIKRKKTIYKNSLFPLSEIDSRHIANS